MLRATQAAHPQAGQLCERLLDGLSGLVLRKTGPFHTTNARETTLAKLPFVALSHTARRPSQTALPILWRRFFYSEEE